jgi:hypothetical protein
MRIGNVDRLLGTVRTRARALAMRSGAASAPAPRQYPAISGADASLELFSLSDRRRYDS